MFGVRARPRGATAGERILPWGSRRRSLVRAPVRALRFAREHGWGAFAARLARPGSWVPRMWERADPDPSAMSPAERYLLWSAIHHRNPRVLGRKARRARALDGPTISVLVPIHDPEGRLLDEAIRSVRSQLYPRWELVLVDDASARREHLVGLRELTRSEPRIRFIELEANAGISGATNRALDEATGRYVAMMDQDDVLAPDALYEVAALVTGAPDLDLVYTDEEKIDEAGRVLDVFFKPEWSPDLELSTNYVNHLTVVRTELLRRLGGLRSEFDGAQDYDTVLRVTEGTPRVGHVPLPLYSWRSVAGSMSESLEAKPWAYEAGMRALQDSLGRRAPGARAEPGSFPGAYDVRFVHSSSSSTVLAVVDGGAADSVESLVEHLTSQGVEVNLATHHGAWGARMNLAARAAAPGSLLLFVHGNTSPRSDDWLARLAEQAQRGDVGAVGPRIVAPGGTTVHEGVVVWAERPVPGPHAAYRPADDLVRNVSAVSGVCMMVSESHFRTLGGFDERMESCASDVDFCLRAAIIGKRTVYVPGAELVHDPGEPWKPAHRDPGFAARWKDYRDPFHSPRFSLREPYVLRL